MKMLTLLLSVMLLTSLAIADDPGGDDALIAAAVAKLNALATRPATQSAPPATILDTQPATSSEPTARETPAK